MAEVRIVGLRGPATFEEVDRHFESLGVDAVLLDPSVVCGRAHLQSAVMHAERAFAEGRNRSRRLVTETILYTVCERQIRRALDLAKPNPASGGMVALVLDYSGDLRLDSIGMMEDDSLIEPSPDKAAKIGAEPFDGVSTEDEVLERVASLDLQKQRGGTCHISPWIPNPPLSN